MKDTEFWRTVNGNFLDLCVLEWCKLFGDKRGEHCWRLVVSDLNGFETGLLGHLKLSATEFEEYVEEIRRYRDGFVAHLDSDKVINIPKLNVAKACVWYYHAHVMNAEAQAGGLEGLPRDIAHYHQECEREGNHAYGVAGGAGE